MNLGRRAIRALGRRGRRRGGGGLRGGIGARLGLGTRGTLCGDDEVDGLMGSWLLLALKMIDVKCCFLLMLGFRGGVWVFTCS